MSGDDVSKTSEGRQVDDGRQKDGISDAKSDKDEEHIYLEDADGPWYLGKAKEEFHKRRSQPVPNRQEEDPIQVCPYYLPALVLFMTIMCSGRETAETQSKNEMVTSAQRITLRARCVPLIARKSSSMNSRRQCSLFFFVL